MEYDRLRDFWTPFFAYALLLGVYLFILGIGLAGLVSALNAREKANKANRHPEPR
jgi:hypothetical protein